MARPKKYMAMATLLHMGKIIKRGEFVHLQSESENTLRLLDQKDIADPGAKDETPDDTKVQETTADQTNPETVQETDATDQQTS